MSFDKHSKIKDILTSLESLVGINQKEELKEVLRNKGLTINDTDSISDMITKINNILISQGNALPEDVIQGKTFSNKDSNTLTGTLDLSIYKRSASGSFYPTNDMEVNNLIEINGIEFQPTIIFVIYEDTINYYYNGRQATGAYNSTETGLKNIGKITPTANGFKITEIATSLFTTNLLEWIAIE